jgi:threonine/homoserine/homoserine lactone efflux protein
VDALLLGLSLGLGAGLAPGPLLALVIRSTLQDGVAAGIRVAFSPLVTDIPIIVLAVVLASSLPETALGALGIVGGVFVIWLGVEALRESPAPVEAAIGAARPQRDLVRGALTNALSPHPWVFWITVGAPILAEQKASGSALFLGAFYLVLIGSKVTIAGVLAAGRERLVQGRGYAIVLRASAVLLLGTGVLLTVEGLQTIG